MIQIFILVMIGLLVYLAVGDDLKRLFRRRVESYRIKYTRYLTRSVMAPTLVFFVLGVLMRDIVLTPFLWLVGGGIAYFRIRQVIAQETSITPRDVSQLVIAFRGAYQLQPAAFKSLEVAADKVRDPLRSMIKIVVNIYFNSARPELAFEEFRKRTNNVLLNQFIYILEMSESASDESVTEALDAFVVRLRRQEELQRQVETGLASITGQTGFMQVLAMIIAYVVALIPGFRGVYSASLVGRLGYIILVSVIIAASYLIEKRIIELKAQML